MREELDWRQRRRLGLALTISVWLLGYTMGRLSGLVEGLREANARARIP